MLTRAATGTRDGSGNGLTTGIRNELATQTDGDRMRAALGSELLQNVRNMGADRLVTEAELSCDLGVCETECDVLEHFALTWRKRKLSLSDSLGQWYRSGHIQILPKLV